MQLGLERKKFVTEFWWRTNTESNI